MFYLREMHDVRKAREKSGSNGRWKKPSRPLHPESRIYRHLQTTMFVFLTFTHEHTACLPPMPR